jgi:hypothetical protein
MTLQEFLEKLQNTPEAVTFDDTMAVIDQYYAFTPSAFTNGDQHNQAGENNGSCKILAFAQQHQLSEPQTLACFGRFYREDVLGQPNGESHLNIRNFMKTGWSGVHFTQAPLSPR